jgi:hypothetical protein
MKKLNSINENLILGELYKFPYKFYHYGYVGIFENEAFIIHNNPNEYIYMFLGNVFIERFNSNELYLKFFSLKNNKIYIISNKSLFITESNILK